MDLSLLQKFAVILSQDIGAANLVAPILKQKSIKQETLRYKCFKHYDLSFHKVGGICSGKNKDGSDSCIVSFAYSI